jgi:uncharacterized protein YjdB
MAFKRNDWGSGRANPGAKYNETWTEANYDNKKSRNAYGSTNITLEENIGEDRMSKLSKYRQEKIANRSEVKVQRHLDDEQRKVDRGTGKSARAIRQGNRQRRRELRRTERTNRRNARNN